MPINKSFWHYFLPYNSFKKVLPLKPGQKLGSILYILSAGVRSDIKISASICSHPSLGDAG